MFTTDWTELLLNSEGMTDFAIVFLESFDVNRNNNIVTDFVILIRSIFIDIITAAAGIHNCISDNLGRGIHPGLNGAAGTVDHLTGNKPERSAPGLSGIF